MFRALNIHKNKIKWITHQTRCKSNPSLPSNADVVIIGIFIIPYKF